MADYSAEIPPKPRELLFAPDRATYEKAMREASARHIQALRDLLTSGRPFSARDLKRIADDSYAQVPLSPEDTV
jgi:hypothetical protein